VEKVNNGELKTVEECEKMLISVGFSQCEVVELHAKIKVIIDGVLDTILNKNESN